MRGARGSAGVDGCRAVAQFGLEIGGDADGRSVVDLPQGSDYVAGSGKLEGGGEVDGLMQQPGVGGDRGVQADR